MTHHRSYQTMTNEPRHAADPTQNLIDEVREHGKPVSGYFEGPSVSPRAWNS